ncbi:MBL fold metallo-hydrolase [Ktedonospora formicarum]|uniref:MBL fold metallo-hydrolase n=1 Tax=Ktedonospora formicarum TaxID=2778364 RepID=A0A8J3IAD9_9CHLR|nr:MBL fold metallo-hydrolase [Ktedonospora formicarum]GHO50228.1 MBL fold metallo-hydrolase [Ktedonospora formicarum]
MKLIMDGISCIEGLRLGNVYVLEASDGLTLVDTSTPTAFPKIEKDILRSGYQLGDIKRILLTHAHWDHYGSLAALIQATGAKVYAHHRYESAVIRGEKKPLHPNPAQLGGFDRLVYTAWVRPHLRNNVSVPVDYELKEGDTLDEVFPGLVVVDEPGHSPGQCGFWLPEQRLLLGGDVMMRAPSGRFLLPMVAATPDLDEAKRSIRKVAELNVDILCLGHGKPYRGNAASALKNFASQLV